MYIDAKRRFCQLFCVSSVYLGNHGDSLFVNSLAVQIVLGLLLGNVDCVFR